MSDPELLKRDALLTDEQGNIVTAEMLEGWIAEYAPMLRFLQDWESGLFIITYADYTMFPALFYDIRKVYHRWKIERAKKNAEGN